MKHILTFFIALLVLFSGTDCIAQDPLCDCENTYKATIVSCYDGDTCTALISLGLGVQVADQKLRLEGIDTPELRGEERAEGLKSRDAIREKIVGKEVTLVITGTGKYGRWITTIYLDGVNINQWLIDSGLAEPY